MYELPQETAPSTFFGEQSDFERLFMSDVTRDDRAGAPRGAECGCVVFVVGEARCPAHGVWS